MATALTATPQVATALAPPSVLLNVTGAPAKPASAYTSNFASGVDGWAGVGTGVGLTNDTTRTPAALKLTGAPNTINAVYAWRAMTGLTIGVRYRVSLMAASGPGMVRLTANGATNGSAAIADTGYFSATTKRAPLTVEFVATGATHVVQVYSRLLYASPSTPTAFYDTITVQPITAWQGTSITRTDVNGTAVPVRLPIGLDTVGGVMAVTDFEAALTGVITYTVTDGLGATATAATTLATESRRNYTLNPRAATTAGWAPGYGTSGAGTFAAATGTGPLPGITTFGRLTWTTPPTAAGAYISYATTNATHEIVVTPGDTITVSQYVRTSAAGQTWRCQVNFYTSAGVYITTLPWSPYATAAATWTRITATGTVPATAARALVYGFHNGGTLPIAGDTFDMSAILVEKAAALGDYFDGATPATPGHDYAWTGAANASQSIDVTPDTTDAPYLSLPATGMVTGPTDAPDFLALTMVTDYGAVSEAQGQVHTVLGRTTHLSNPGPLVGRTGDMDVFCPTYADAKAVRDLLASPNIAQLRQSNFPGMDMYFIARAVRVAPDGAFTPTRRWLVSVAYDEQDRPA